MFLMFVSSLSFGQIISIGSPVSGTEGVGGNISFVVSLDNGVINNSGGNIFGSISYVGTATQGIDYVAAATFSIPNGSNSTTITLPLVDDILCEGTESVTATISNPNVGSINPSNATSSTTIFDDDCGAILISIENPINGVEGSSDVSFQISIVAGGPSAVAITGAIAYSGTAIDGSDFSGLYSYTIPAGSMFTTVVVPVINDLIIEPTESVIATLTGSPNIGTYANTTSTAYIYDDDGASLTLSIGSPSNGIEATTNVSYVISIDNGIINTTGSPITGSINYTGTAISSVDYIEALSFTIPDGSNSTTISLPVIDDALVECDETVIATLTSSNIGSINPTTGSSTAIIVDDECSQVSISIGSPVDGAEGGANASFIISIDGGLINSTGSAIIGAMGFFGDAGPAFDYSPSSTGFSIPNGQNSTVITLTVIDDNCVEFAESASIMISNPSVGFINNSTSTAYIVDNDAGGTTISIGSPVDGSENGTVVNYTISLDGGLMNCSGVPITGSISYAGTATVGVDYLDINSFSIPNGSSFTIVSVPVFDDALFECDETIIATISNPSVGTINPSATSSSAIIEDDECVNDLADLSDVEVSIYPNPVNDQFSIVSDYFISDYSIYDLNGRKIQSTEVDSQQIQVSIESLSSGTYLIEIHFENGTSIRKKILKE